MGDRPNTSGLTESVLRGNCECGGTFFHFLLIFIIIGQKSSSAFLTIFPPALTFTCSFFALPHFLFLFHCWPPDAPAFHYCSQHFSAYTSDRVGVLANRNRGQRAVDIMPHCRQQRQGPTRKHRHDWLPQRPAITRDCTLCFYAGLQDM